MARTRGRPRHPKKEVEEAVRYAESRGWRVDVGGSHNWGALLCPAAGGCRLPVYSTPANPWAHGRRIKHQVDRCPHETETP